MKFLEKHNVVKFIEAKNVKTFTKREIVNELYKYYKNDFCGYYYVNLIENILNDLLKEKYLTASYFSEQRVHGSVTVALYDVK